METLDTALSTSPKQELSLSDIVKELEAKQSVTAPVVTNKETNGASKHGVGTSPALSKENGSTEEEENPAEEVWQLKKEVAQLNTRLQTTEQLYQDTLKDLNFLLQEHRNQTRRKQLKKKLIDGVFNYKLFDAHKAGIYAIRHNDDVLFTASGDKTIKMWDIRTGAEKKTFVGHKSGVCCLDLTETHVISGSWDKTIRVTNIQTSESRELKAHVNGVRCLQVSGNILASGASDKIIFLWNLQQGQCELILKGHEGAVFSLQLLGNRLISASGDQTLKLWDIESGSNMQTFKGHEADVYCTKVRNNTVISGSSDKTLRVWDLNSKHCLRTMPHPDGVYGCAITDNLVITACGDSTVRIWDHRICRPMRIIQVHKDAVNCLDFDPSTATLSSGSSDKTAAFFAFP